MAELTPTGYKLKTQNEWFEDERDRYLDVDPKWNLDASTPDGLKLSSDAEIFGNLDEVGQRAYNSKDPNKTSGIDLNVISALTGTIRSQGTPSNVELTLGGVIGTLILAGKIVKSSIDDSQWSTDTNATIGVGGTVTVNATAISNGSTQADIGTINKISTTVGGWQTVTNLTVATPGTNIQNDSSLRLERAKSVSRPGNNQLDNMLGEVFSVDGVRRAVILENDTDTNDFYGNGLPKNSIAPIIDGGVDASVALAIFRKKNPGCKLFASGTSVNVADVYDVYPSNKKDITFSRPTYVEAIVTVNVQSDGTLPNDADEQIKQAIVDYSAGELVAAECGFNVLGFDIGEDVPVSRIGTPVNQIIGKYGNSYLTGLTVNTLSFGGIVPIAVNELSRWTIANVTVTINV
tara:strand:- start:7153 stop:8367 length:1215 start_codon:yes stop_codon:yes gene_type:complete